MVQTHKLHGARRGDKWEFACESFPAIAREHNGKPDIDEAVSDFMMLALANARLVLASAKKVVTPPTHRRGK